MTISELLTVVQELFTKAMLMTDTTAAELSAVKGRGGASRYSRPGGPLEEENPAFWQDGVHELKSLRDAQFKHHIQCY